MATTAKWHEARPDTRLKLSALSSTILFFYVYADLFAFFGPKVLRQITDGTLLPFLITQPMMLGFAVMMSIPTILILLSLALKANQSRWSDIVVGAADGSWETLACRIQERSCSWPGIEVRWLKKSARA
jgi:hypothetical protein